MTSKTAQFEQSLQKVQYIIAQTTGNELEDVAPDSILEDLSLYGVDLKRVIVAINSAFGISLDSEEVEDEIETVHNLAMVVHEEAFLG